MISLNRRILMLVLNVVTHPVRTLTIAAVILAAAIGISVWRLNISSDQNDLFSDKVGFFHNYLEFIRRFRENEAVYIVIEPKDFVHLPSTSRWADVANHVTQKLRDLHDDVEKAQCGIPVADLGKQGILFEDQVLLPQRLAGAQQLAQLAKLWGEKPSGMTSLFGPTPIDRFISGAGAAVNDQAAGFVADMADSWRKCISDPNLPMRPGGAVLDLATSQAANPRELGYNYVPDETHLDHFRILVQVFPVRKLNSLTAVTETVDAIRDTAVKAAGDFPEFQVGVTGRPALDADEMRTTDIDSHRAEIVALITVFMGMAVMLRSLWLALAAEIALGFGIGWTFGWTTLTVGQLNLLSLVFLIALIGIGMDYLVQILTRYRLEARRYTRPSAVWIRVFAHVGPPINTACAGAAGAFLVAIFTSFRGAAELGIVAGGGLLLCLAAGYTVLPALLTLFPTRLEPLDQRYVPPKYSSGAKSFLLPAAWLVLLAAGLPFMPRTQFDPGLITLQVPNLESVKLINTLQTWSLVVLSPDLNLLAEIREKVAGLDSVKSTESLLNTSDNFTWLQKHSEDLPKIAWAEPTPISSGDFPRIEAKAENLAGLFAPAGATRPTDFRQRAADSLRGFAAALKSADSTAAQRLSQWQVIFQQELRDNLDQFRPEPLDASKVPPDLLTHFLSPDGTYALYVYPKKDLWIRSNLAEFVTQVESAEKTVPGAPAVTGIASDVYHTTDAIHAAFVQSTVYALILIFILVLLDFRKLGPTLAAISVLALGLPMLVAIMGLLGVDWNFANFFGLPILIGAGHEYGVFMVHRYLEARKYPRRVWAGWDVSDRALLLCGFITSSSFGFFWLLARHQGLKSLGLVMAVGTGCIYLATLAVLRPLLRLKLGKSHKA
jgi:hypothetical protein